MLSYDTDWQHSEGVMSNMPNPDLVESEYKKFANQHRSYSDCIVLDRPFPFELFKVYDEWVPAPVKLLLLAESPPYADYPLSYFYNADYCGNLSTVVFELFQISGESKKTQLERFRDRLGYILIDTLMCAFDTSKRNIPISLAEYSGEKIIRQEIENLRPRSILALGRRALYGLKAFEPFADGLRDVKSVYRSGTGPVIFRRCGNVDVVVSPFPNDNWNKRHWCEVKEAFQKAADVAARRC
jgi:hypothetical protein